MSGPSSFLSPTSPSSSLSSGKSPSAQPLFGIPSPSSAGSQSALRTPPFQPGNDLVGVQHDPTSWMNYSDTQTLGNLQQFSSMDPMLSESDVLARLEASMNFTPSAYGGFSDPSKASSPLHLPDAYDPDISWQNFVEQVQTGN